MCRNWKPHLHILLMSSAKRAVLCARFLTVGSILIVHRSFLQLSDMISLNLRGRYSKLLDFKVPSPFLIPLGHPINPDSSNPFVFKKCLSTWISSRTLFRLTSTSGAVALRQQF